jgi:hypothetical protein
MKIWKHTFEAQDGKTYEATSTDDAESFAAYLNALPDNARRVHEAHGNEAMLHGCVRVVRSE